jgi:alpha-L-rhamnosidase
MCFNRNAASFLESWMTNVRAEQMKHGEIPMIVPYLKAYSTFLKDHFGSDTSCGWGDAVLMVPLAAYKAYGDQKILEDNYEAMKGWVSYIEWRAENVHPEGYDSFSPEQKARDRYLWSTDFHFGDWLVPSMVLGNPDASAMDNTAYATMRYVAPAYYAFSVKNMADIASILGHDDDAAAYRRLYEKIRDAYISEYVHDDGTMDANLQGIYVITLKMDLVPDEIRPKMVERLCEMISENGDKLDTGFLSVLFLMDVLCDNGREDVAYKLLFQTGCPGWLYEVVSGGSTMWESWGAVGEDGSVSTYSYNHYAFGCVGDWMYRYIGGLSALEPGYKKILVKPHLNCGLKSVDVSEETPYGKAAISWNLVDEHAFITVTVPANTTAEICINGVEKQTVGSGTYHYYVLSH